MTTHMRVGRMRRWSKWLRKFRETKRRHFDMAVVRERTVECGTAACAIGWLPSLFPAQWVAVCAHGLDWVRPRGVCTGDGEFADARAFFGLTKEQLDRIALPDSYRNHPVTPGMVADRIDEIIAERGKAEPR